MEALLHGAKMTGAIECLGRVLEGSGVHRQCWAGERCVKGKKTAVCEKVTGVVA